MSKILNIIVPIASEIEDVTCTLSTTPITNETGMLNYNSSSITTIELDNNDDPYEIQLSFNLLTPKIYNCLFVGFSQGDDTVNLINTEVVNYVGTTPTILTTQYQKNSFASGGLPMLIYTQEASGNKVGLRLTPDSVDNDSTIFNFLDFAVGWNILVPMYNQDYSIEYEWQSNAWELVKNGHTYSKSFSFNIDMQYADFLNLQEGLRHFKNKYHVFFLVEVDTESGAISGYRKLLLKEWPSIKKDKYDIYNVSFNTYLL